MLQRDCTCSWSFATKVKLNDIVQAKAKDLPDVGLKLQSA